MERDSVPGAALSYPLSYHCICGKGMLVNLPKHRTQIPLFDTLDGDRVRIRPFQASDAEAHFAAHTGGLQEMVVERARADVALQIAAAAAQRTAQGLQTLLGMQL